MELPFLTIKKILKLDNEYSYSLKCEISNDRKILAMGCIEGDIALCMDPTYLE
jgi:hypothetical protein